MVTLIVYVGALSICLVMSGLEYLLARYYSEELNENHHTMRKDLRTRFFMRKEYMSEVRRYWRRFYGEKLRYPFII